MHYGNYSAQTNSSSQQHFAGIVPGTVVEIKSDSRFWPPRPRRFCERQRVCNFCGRPARTPMRTQAPLLNLASQVW